MDRENGEWWFLTPYPTDLDPLDTSLRHLSLTLSDPNAKRPLSMVFERSVWVGSGYWQSG